MNVINTALIRAAASGASLLLLPVAAAARDSVPADSAARLFAATGFVPVKAAKPYREPDSVAYAIQVGSWRATVADRLGRPSAVLEDGTWLYRNFTVDESLAHGTLVVQFDHGDVSRLSLVSPKVEAAMLTSPANEKRRTLVASK